MTAGGQDNDGAAGGGYVDLAQAKKAERAAVAEEGGAAGDGTGPAYGKNPEDPCPVTALGRNAGVYYFLSPSGAYTVVKRTEFKNEAVIEDIFDAHMAWPIRNFPARDRDGNIVPGGWSPRPARTFLMRACTSRAPYDVSVPVRGPGVWRDGAGNGTTGRPGGLLVHAGDALYLDGEWRRPGLIRGDSIYAAFPKCGRPDFVPGRRAGRDQGRAVEAAVRLWRFESDIGPDILLGFLGAAMLGGAPHWRVHLMVSGRHGSGKSALAELVAAVLGGGAVSSNNVTEAGLRQSLTGQARAVVLDEAESGDDHVSARIRQVIQLLRLMASGAGAKVSRGSAGGQATAFSVTGCAYLSAILPPPLTPQDRSRIATLHLAALPEGREAAGGAERARDAIAAMAEASGALRARAIAGWARFLETFACYRAAFMSKGCDNRDADRIATFLAGRDLLLQDDVPEGNAIEDEIDRFLEMMTDAAEAEDEGEGQQCFTHLMTSPLDLWSSGQRRVVGEIVVKACRMEGATEREELRKIGLRLENLNAETGPVLLVANQHVALAKIFHGTRWTGGGWKGALIYIGATAWPRPARFAGVQVRAMAVPNAALPRDDDDEIEGETDAMP